MEQMDPENILKVMAEIHVVDCVDDSCVPEVLLGLKR